MNLSIRAKIVLITLMILFLTIAVNILISSYVFTREYSDSLQSETFVIGRGLALQLDRLLRLGIPVEEIVGFEKQCQEIVNKYEEISYAMVVDTDGKILFHNDPSRHGQVLSDSAMLEAVKGAEDVVQVYSQQGEKYYDVTIPAFDIHGKHTAAVKIGFPARLIAQKTQGLATYSVVVAFVSLGVATALLVFTLSAWVTSPLMRLLAVIQEIRKEGTHSAKRVEIDSKDEIGQLGSAFNQMISELKESHEKIRRHTEELEQRVADRTRNLQIATEVARATTSVLEPDTLLHQTVDLIRDRFDLYYVGLFLLDEEWRFAVLRAGTGEAGQKMLAQGYRLEVGGDSVIGQCTTKAEACIALDVGEEVICFDSPLLPETRSEMALPLRARGEIIGALDVQSQEPEAFSDEDVAVLQTLADQVATAISNARLYDQAQQEITERRRTEEALRVSEERFALAVQGSNDGIWDWDIQNNTLYWSPRLKEILGYADDELDVDFDTFEALLQPDDREHTTAAIEAHLRDRKLFDAEQRLRTKSGEYVWARARGQAIWDENGQPIRMVGSTTDITARKRAEEALRESEERYRLLFERNLAGVYRTTLDGRILDCNEAFARIFGYDSQEEVMSRQASELYFDAASRETFIAQVREQGTLTNFEYRLRRKDGSSVWILENSSLIEGKEGTPTFLQGTLIDITERKRAEQLLRALNQAGLAMERALTQEEIFAAVAEELTKLGFSCVVFLVDENQSRMCPKYLSYETKLVKAAEKLMGLKAEDFSIPVETVDAYRKVIWERKTAFVENAEDIVRQVLPKPVKRLAGQLVRILKIQKSISAPLIVEDKVIGLLLVQSDDLTEEDIPAITAFAHQMAAAWHKAQLLQNLDRSLEELKRTQTELIQSGKLAAIGQLVAGVAHELNNPLTSVVGYSQLLLGADCSEEIKRDLDRINRQALRAARIVENLLTFARRREPHKESININDVIEKSLELQAHQLELDRISIVKDLDEALPPTMADPFQMQQVFMNIIGNAHQALRDSDGERQLRVKSELAGDMIHLEFADSGPGIPPEVMGRLFEPFFTTREVGEGTGLGLSISYGIVEAHGGRIWANSKIGKGATFIVEIPVKGV